MPPASTTWRALLALLAITLCTAAPALADDAVTDDDWRDGVSLEDTPTGGVADPGEDDPGRKVPSYIDMCEAADGCDLTTDDDGTLGSKGKHATGVAVAAGATDQATAPPDTPVAPAPDTTVKVQGTGEDKQVVVSDDDSSSTLPCSDHATLCGAGATAVTVGTVVWAILRNGTNADGSRRPNVLERQRMRYIDEVLSDEDATGAERSKAIEYAREMGGKGITLSSFPRSFQAFVLDDPSWLEHDRPFREIGALGIPEGADARTVQSAQNAWISVLRYVNGAGPEQWGRAQDVADDLASEGFTLPEGYRAWAEANAIPAADRGTHEWVRPDDQSSDHGSDGHSDYDPDDRWPSLDDDFEIPRDPVEHRGTDYDGGRINHQDPAADHGRGGADHGGRAGGVEDDPHRRPEDDPHRRGEHVEAHRGVPHGSAHPVFHGF